MSKVLVIDDDAIMLKAINHILSKNGYEVEMACDGKEGIEKIEISNYDLVITDIMMPHHNGLAVLSSIRKNPLRSKTKMIAMSSAGNMAIRAEAINLGASDFMIKPIVPNYLLETVKKHTSNIAQEKVLVTRKPAARG